MAIWTRQPQEREGSYYFSGQFLVTREVITELSKEEILSIYHDIQRFVQEQNGIDYLQTYFDEKERKLFFIDQLNKKTIESGDFKKQDDHCTLLFAHEY